MMGTLIEFLQRNGKNGSGFFMSALKVAVRGPTNVVVTGTIEKGKISAGDTVEIIGRNSPQQVLCRKVTPISSSEGVESVEISLIGDAEINVGDVLAKPGTVKMAKELVADVYVLQKDEGGAGVPLNKNSPIQATFRTMDVTGSIELPEGVEMVMPGDNVSMTVTLIYPIAMDDGLRFAIREGGRNVAVGLARWESEF